MSPSLKTTQAATANCVVNILKCLETILQIYHILRNSSRVFSLKSAYRVNSLLDAKSPKLIMQLNLDSCEVLYS